VEDQLINRRLLLKYLEKLGYTDVAAAADGLLAIEAAKQRPYDIIIMDVFMPRSEMRATDLVATYSLHPLAYGCLTCTICCNIVAGVMALRLAR